MKSRQHDTGHNDLAWENTTMKIAYQKRTISKRDLLCERVYSYLKHAILNGLMEADERLIEERIAAELGISRTPIREAIHKLEQEGFVYKRPSGGHAISPTDQNDAREMRDVAGIILGYAAYLATFNATAKDLDMLRRITKAMEEHFEICDHEKVINESCRFYDALLVLSNNNQLRIIFNGLNDHLVRKLFTMPTAKKRLSLLKNHRMLIDLMEAKQAARAEKIARKLIFKRICLNTRVYLDVCSQRNTSPKPPLTTYMKTDVSKCVGN